MSPEQKFIRQVHSMINSLHHQSRWIRYILALGLIVVGIVGIILPVMPGWIFLIPGIAIISPKFGLWLENQSRRYIDWSSSRRNLSIEATNLKIKSDLKH